MSTYAVLSAMAGRGTGGTLYGKCLMRKYGKAR